MSWERLRDLVLILVAAAVMGAFALAFVRTARDCDRLGGTLVRSSVWYACVHTLETSSR